LRDQDLKASLAEKGRKRVLAQYTQAKVAAQTHRVYQQILAAE